jgi:hypothetical protein
VVPTRINHLSLTILNAFLAWKTLSAIQVSVYSLTYVLTYSLIYSITFIYTLPR